MSRRRDRSGQLRFLIGLVALFLVCTWVCLLVWALVPSGVLGWDSITLTSNSMAPSLDRGDVVVASPHNGQDLGPGTVVIFRDPARPGLVTHRIVAITPDGSYVTKGDGNPRLDSTPLLPGQVQGVGRLLVPMVALPLVWAWSGAWANLAAWGAIALMTLWCSRWGLFDQFDPTLQERRRVGRPQRVGGYRARHRAAPALSTVGLLMGRTSILLVVGVGLVLVTALTTPALALFSSAAINSGNQLKAGIVSYLHNNPTPPVGDTNSQAVLPMDWTYPTAGVLYNYDQDRDGDPGLLLSKSSGLSETDPAKHQIWSRSLTEPLQLQGQAFLTVWSSIKGFDTSKRGVVLAALLDCDAGGSGCVTIASGSLDVTPWNTGPTWVSRTIDLGSVNYTIAASRTLRVKLVVGPDAGDDMWFAYDTSSYPSQLRVQP